MNEVMQKYPWHDAGKIQKAWFNYQYAQQGVSFLDFYEKTLTPTEEKKHCDLCGADFSTSSGRMCNPEVSHEKIMSPEEIDEILYDNYKDSSFIEKTVEEFRNKYQAKEAHGRVEKLGISVMWMDSMCKFLRDKLEEATQDIDKLSYDSGRQAREEEIVEIIEKELEKVVHGDPKAGAISNFGLNNQARILKYVLNAIRTNQDT